MTWWNSLFGRRMAETTQQDRYSMAQRREARRILTEQFNEENGPWIVEIRDVLLDRWLDLVGLEPRNIFECLTLTTGHDALLRTGMGIKDNQLDLDMNLFAQGRLVAEIEAILDHNTMTLDLAVMALHLDGMGATEERARLVRGLIALARLLEVKGLRVMLPSIEAHLWAQHGFAPTPQAWRALKTRWAIDPYQAAEAAEKTNTPQAHAIAAALATPDPCGIWELYKGDLIVNGESVRRKVQASGWPAVLDVRNTTQLAKAGYEGDKIARKLLEI